MRGGRDPPWQGFLRLSGRCVRRASAPDALAEGSGDSVLTHFPAVCSMRFPLWKPEAGWREACVAGEGRCLLVAPLCHMARASSLGANSGQSSWKKGSENRSFSLELLSHQARAPGLGLNLAT